VNLQRSVLLYSSVGALALVLSACGNPSAHQNPRGSEAQVPADSDRGNSLPQSPQGGVVKARAKLNLVLGADGNGKGEILAMAMEPMQPVVPEIEIFAGQRDDTDVSVTLPVSQFYALDLTAFNATPTISNAVISFGNLGILDNFYDNNVKVCGASQNGQCTKASIRAYTLQASTVATPGDGLWNADGGYGAPLTIANAAGVNQLILLGQANSKELHSFNFPGSKRVLTFADWQALSTYAPNYAVSADFTLAGAGVYSATIVLDYVLN
jgi:hypothetical protein